MVASNPCSTNESSDPKSIDTAHHPEIINTPFINLLGLFLLTFDFIPQSYKHNDSYDTMLYFRYFLHKTSYQVFIFICGLQLGYFIYFFYNSLFY